MCFYGLLRKEQLQALKNAGVTSYHHNIETSKRFFPSICTTHTYEMKIQTIKLAQEIGLHVCSGGIIGMGETFEDRIDMALSLAELNIESIPINALMPIPRNMLTTSGNTIKEDMNMLKELKRIVDFNSSIIIFSGNVKQVTISNI